MVPAYIFHVLDCISGKLNYMAEHDGSHLTSDNKRQKGAPRSLLLFLVELSAEIVAVSLRKCMFRDLLSVR
jgi:hypothetical protein